ncbi:hypothetical protein LX36DRAFT_326164 [Colletotrichum falcatum]|nr:hypothetical protein LX36DRAFT_326164 [Colletotrichum falcatum]
MRWRRGIVTIATSLELCVSEYPGFDICRSLRKSTYHNRLISIIIIHSSHRVRRAGCQTVFHTRRPIRRDKMPSLTHRHSRPFSTSIPTVRIQHISREIRGFPVFSTRDPPPLPT